MADMSLANLMNLRAKAEPYHPQTVTKDVSTMAALTSPILGVDDMRWVCFSDACFVGRCLHEVL